MDTFIIYKNQKNTQMQTILIRKSRFLRVCLLSTNVFHNIEIDIEIQVAKFPSWQARSLFYWSKLYSEQIQSGQDYDKNKIIIF